MKPLSFHRPVSRRRALWFASGSLVAVLIAVGAVCWSSLAVASSNEPAPLIAVLTPHEGASLNSASLRVQALVAAVRSRNGETFVFNGQTVAGRNAGRIRRVELAMDGVPLQSIETTSYGRQIVADFRVDLSAVGDGLHILTIKAVQGGGRDETSTSATVSFTLDRSLVPAETNLIEEAATPNAFAGFRVRGWDGRDDDEDDEDAWQCPPRFDLKGTLALGSLSDGLDPAVDRVVVALGSQTKVLEPGALNCNRRERVCRFEDGTQPFVQFMELKRRDDGRWKFRLRGASPLPANARSLYLRIGNDWGGIDLATGERLVGLRPNLDTSRQAQALIGAAGGTVETVDVTGALLRLTIPPTALTRDTLITMTPLLTSPLAGDTGAVHPGVQFEPEGLIFAQAAILTIDLSATGHAVTDNDFLFLVTSPLTALPLYGQADPQTSTITAELPHFSSAGARNAPAPYVDFAAWTNAYLASASFPSQAVLRTLTSLARLQRQIGCAANCINQAQLAARIRADIEALVQRSCPLDIGDPSDAALARYLALETLAQAANVQVPLLRQCVARVLEALIDKTYQNGIAAPFNQAHLERLLQLTARAQLLGITSAENLGRRRIEDLLRVMINYEAAVAAATPTEAALDRVTRLHQVAHQLGFTNLETLAARGLATALRVLLTRGRQLCSGSDGSGGLILLYRAQNYAPLVTQVDAALASEIQAAIDACQGASIRVTFLRDSGGPGEPGPFPSSFGYTSLFDRQQQARYCERRTPLVSDTRAPLTFDPAACAPNSLTINASVLQNGLALDANAFTAEDGILRTFLSMSIDFQRAGTLSAQVNTSWATAGTFCFVTFSQADSSPYSPLVNWDWTGSNSNAALGTVPIANPTVQKYLFYLDCNSPDLGNTPNGSGRLLTLTFTQSP